MRSGGAGGNNSELPASFSQLLPIEPSQARGRGDKQAAVSLGTLTSASASPIRHSPMLGTQRSIPKAPKRCWLGLQHPPWQAEPPQQILGWAGEV